MTASSDSKLVVGVSDLLASPGEARHVFLQTPVEDLSSGLATVTGPVTVDASLHSMEDGIVVRGQVSGSYRTQCRRCLDEAVREFRVELSELYRLPGTEVWEEGYEVQGETIDLDPAVRDNVGLELPMFPVCRDDCLGLCPTCGTNLNEGPCDCPADEVDPRWSALKGMLGDGAGS